MIIAMDLFMHGNSMVLLAEISWKQIFGMLGEKNPKVQHYESGIRSIVIILHILKTASSTWRTDKEY